MMSLFVQDTFAVAISQVNAIELRPVKVGTIVAMTIVMVMMTAMNETTKRNG